jgi:phytoene dehydrogenase-like protein
VAIAAVAHELEACSLMSKACDVVVGGAGQSGLVRGSYLAKFGRKKPALERRSVVGSAALTQEIERASRASIFSHLTILRPRIMADIDLRRRSGPRIMPWSNSPAPRDGCDQIILLDRVAKTAKHFGRSNKEDGKIYLPNEWHNCRMIEDGGLLSRRRPVGSLGSYTN